MKWSEKIFWICFGSGFVSTLILGLIGFQGESGAFYKTLQLFVLEYNGPPEPGRFLAIARILGAVTSAAAVVRAICGIFREQWHTMKLGRMKNHIVICGLGRKGYELARRLMSAEKVVIIERDENNVYAASCRNSGAFFLCGDASDTAMLKAARIECAKEVYLFTGSDGANFSALVKLAEICSKKASNSKKISVWLHLKTLEMCSFLRDEKIIASVRQHVDLNTVNLFETAARDLVVNQLVPLLPVRSDDKRRIHLIQVGFGQMGQAIVKTLAQTAVTANRLIPKATVISLDAQKDLYAMVREVPQIKSFCELEGIDGDILRGHTRQQIAELVRVVLKDGDVPVVCLAVNCQCTNVSAALFIAELFKSDGIKETDTIPLFVRQTESDGWSALVNDLSQQKDGAYRHIIGFGDLSDLCSEESLKQSHLDQMALAVHQAYLAANDPQESPTHQAWDKLNWHTKQTNRLAVDHIKVKLRVLGLDYVRGTFSGKDLFMKLAGENLEVLSKLEHCRWMTAKQLSNWSVGKETNYEEKIHACLVAWDVLPDKEKKKDYDQILAIPDILQAGGYSIVVESNAYAKELVANSVEAEDLLKECSIL